MPMVSSNQQCQVATIRYINSLEVNGYLVDCAVTDGCMYIRTDRWTDMSDNPKINVSGIIYMMGGSINMLPE